MTQFNFQPYDPRLTAYALGELDPTERAQVEALLAESAEARTELEGIRETIALLSRELTFEPAFNLTASQRESVEQAASLDNGERLGVSPPCSAVVDTEGLRQAARLSKSRWGAIARTATTVAVVAAVVEAVPLVSRYLSDRLQNPSSNEELIVASNSAPGVAMARDETTPFGSTDSSAVIRESQSASSASDSSEAIAATSKRQDGEAVASFVADESAGKPVSGESLAASLPADESGLNGPVDSLSADKEGKPAVVVAGQANAGGSAGESNDGWLMSGAGVGGNIASRPSDNNSGGLENEALLLASSDPEPESMRESKVSVEFELRGRSVAATTQPQPGEDTKASDSQAATARRSELAIVDARVASKADHSSDGIESRGLGRLDDGVELSKHPFARFRILNESARGTAGEKSETYEPIVENAFLTPMEQPLSTFSIDVDTASYANMRRFIQQGQLPPANAVRIEELVNYFRYDYPEPADGSPFSVNIDVATCPWNPQHKLARVGLKAKTIAEDKRPATNLVFLIDVSGSMAAENKLPLVKQALSVLVSKMGENDQIAIVTYAGEAGLKLNSTSGSQQAVIQQAIDSLQSGGSTNGAAGINIAYDTAIQSFIKGGANRVILCTDGDFNVGVSDDNTLVEIIQEKAASGVFLSVFGFGMGNLKDAKLEKLADKGNGNYGYIDGLGEARKVFGEQLSGTLITVAKDVKLQLEFNNSTVGAYRLIGYENRVLAAKDFDDDTKDAGEIGAGHTVTALYEIVPKAAWMSQAGLDPEKFDIVEKPAANDETKEAADGRLFTVKLRHKLPDTETSEKSQDYAAMNSDVQLSESNVDFRFTAAVASFGMQIRDSKFRGNWTLQNVLSMADASLSSDRNGERTEFTDLVRGVMRIKGESVTDPRRTMHETVAPVTPSVELPAELSANDARIKATVDGKYRRLLKKIEVRSDVGSYRDFKDYGQWDGTSYSGHSDLPTGYWVWVYPNWYIWGDVVESENFE